MAFNPIHRALVLAPASRRGNGFDLVRHQGNSAPCRRFACHARHRADYPMKLAFPERRQIALLGLLSGDIRLCVLAGEDDGRLGVFGMSQWKLMAGSRRLGTRMQPMANKFLSRKMATALAVIGMQTASLS